MWLSDLRKMEEIIHTRAWSSGSSREITATTTDWVFAEDVKEEDEDE